MPKVDVKVIIITQIYNNNPNTSITMRPPLSGPILEIEPPDFNFGRYFGAPIKKRSVNGR